MEVNTHTVTGLLRVFLIGRNGYEDEMSDWLAPSNVDHLIDLSGPQLASLLAFICDELACSSRIISNEVDRTIELQISLRRDKFNLEAKIRKYVATSFFLLKILSYVSVLNAVSTLETEKSR